MKRGKKYRSKEEDLTKSGMKEPREAISWIRENHYAKFDESVDVNINLGVDPRKADQIVRGNIVLPNGTGKVPKVLVFAQGEKASEAENAGADYVGAEDLVEKIQGGWLEFDVAIATPEVMKIIGRLGKVLGSRGLMPNPKSGTVTFDVENAVRDSKAGKIEYRVDKAGNLHVSIGRLSFDKEKIKENIMTFVDSVLRAKPSSTKGTYIKSITISSTMGPGIKIDRIPLLQSLAG